MNKIWYNRALYYFHIYQKFDTFRGEFNWIRKELGIITPISPPPVKPSEDDTNNT